MEDMLAVTPILAERTYSEELMTRFTFAMLKTVAPTLEATTTECLGFYDEKREQLNVRSPRGS
jgi:hypothetical protein